MPRDNNFIDDAFREEFGNFEVTPPDMVWSNIERKLNHKRLVRYMTIGTSMAASVALLLTLGLQFSDRNSTSKPATLAAVNTSAQPDLKIPKKIVVAQIEPSAVSGTEKKVRTSDIATKENTETNHAGNTLASNEETNTSATVPETVESPKTINNSSKEITTTYYFSKQDASVLKSSARDAALLADTTAAKISSSIADNAGGVVSNNVNLLTNEPLEVPQKPREKRWSLECQVAPLYSYRNISQTDDNAAKKAYNQNESGLLAYTGGFKVNYKTSRRFSVQAGLYYSVMGQTASSLLVQNTSSTQSSQVISGKKPSLGDAIAVLQTRSFDVSTKVVASTTFGNAEVVVSSSTSSAELTQQLKFIELPLMARYKIIDQKIGLHVVGGLCTNLLVNNNLYLTQNGSRSSAGTTQDVKRFNYSSTLGFGVNYQLFDNFDLSIEPTCRYYINSITSNSSLKVHPYSFGVFTGLAYKF